MMRNSIWSFLRQKGLLFKVGLVICLFWVIVALISPFLPTQYTLAQDIDIKYSPPSAEHWFGTDEMGRDVFARVMVGSSISLSAGLLTVVSAFVFGILYGGIAGYKGGVVDEVMMRIAELVMSFPPLILAMVIAAALGPSLLNSIIAIAIIWWPNYARLMRSMVISLKELEYVTAARALGASHLRILVTEILPNSVGPLLIMSTLDFGNAILMFSGLSFLGLGTQIPTPEWGIMVSSGMDVFSFDGSWWAAMFPGLAIFTIAVGTNFVGDGLRDYLDPKLKKKI